MVAATTEWSLVTADAREAIRARCDIRQFLTLEADAGRSDMDATELIVGELVANVIRHAPGVIGIHVSWLGHEAILIVTDRGAGVPFVRCVPDERATSGRGLFLIQALARTVEIEAVPGRGSRVIVHLPVYRA
jgi:anti-sigma regulatory factor (Ser/Thr protein kinase)